MKYDVTIKECKQYCIEEVEAKDEQQAQDKAWSLFEADPSDYFDDMNTEIDVRES